MPSSGDLVEVHNLSARKRKSITFFRSGALPNLFSNHFSLKKWMKNHKRVLQLSTFLNNFRLLNKTNTNSNQFRSGAGLFNYRSVICALGFMVIFISYVLRTNISIAIISMSKEFGWSSSMQGKNWLIFISIA